MLKVKIKKSWDKHSWYANRIGEVFFVDQRGPIFSFLGVRDMAYYLVDNNIHAEQNHMIFKKDCKEVI